MNKQKQHTAYCGYKNILEMWSGESRVKSQELWKIVSCSRQKVPGAKLKHNMEKGGNENIDAAEETRISSNILGNQMAKHCIEI